MWITTVHDQSRTPGRRRGVQGLGFAILNAPNSGRLSSKNVGVEHASVNSPVVYLGQIGTQVSQVRREFLIAELGSPIQ